MTFVFFFLVVSLDGGVFIHCHSSTEVLTHLSDGRSCTCYHWCWKLHYIQTSEHILPPTWSLMKKDKRTWTSNVSHEGTIGRIYVFIIQQVYSSFTVFWFLRFRSYVRKWHHQSGETSEEGGRANRNMSRRCVKTWCLRKKSEYKHM